MAEMLKKEKHKFCILNESWLDNVMFIIVAATAFTAVLCHWVLDIAFKYTIEDNGLNIDFKAVFVLLAIPSVYYLFKKRKIYFDFELILLLQVMVFAAVIDYQNQGYVEVCYAWIIPIAYIIGKLVIGQNVKTVNNRIIFLYVVVAVPAFINGALDIGVNWANGWQYGTERWNGFWINYIQPRTTYEYGFILTTAALGFVIYEFKRHKKIVAVYAIMLVLEQYMLYKVEGRQNPVLVVLTLMFTAALVLFDRWSAYDIESKKKVFKIVGYGIIAIVVFAIIFNLNLFGIKDAYEHSYWSPGGFLKNERFFRNWLGFKHMVKYPLIDYAERYGYYYSHSLILEYGRLFGLTNWGLLTLFRILLFVQAFRMAISKGANSWIKYLMVPAFLAVNIYYTMEPNGAAHRHFWMLGLFISGMIRGWLELEEESRYIKKLGNLRKYICETVDDK